MRIHLVAHPCKSSAFIEHHRIERRRQKQALHAAALCQHFQPAQQGRGIALDLLRWLEELAQGRGVQRVFLSASLNAVAFYERAGFMRVRDEVYAHRSGIGIASVFMEKMLSFACDGPVPLK